MPLEYITTRKNGLALIHKNYMLTKDAEFHGKIYWKCVAHKTKCRGRVHVLGDEVVHEIAHNHEPNRAKIEADLAIQEFKRIASVCPSPNNIIISKIAGLSEEVQKELPPIANIQRIINRSIQLEKSNEELKELKRILLVGQCTREDYYFMSKFPEEDSITGNIARPNSNNKCESQSLERSGRASNIATVLSVMNRSLTSKCIPVIIEFLGSLVRDNFFNFFKHDFKKYAIEFENCRIHEEGKTPSSVIICSEDSGSQTMIENEGNVPELIWSDFKEKINLVNYEWIHFEGRNPEELFEMVKQIEEFNSQNPIEENESEYNYKNKTIPISIDVEKNCESLTPLIQLADVVFIGKDHALMKGAKSPSESVRMFSKYVQLGALLICPWGDQGTAFTLAGKGKVKRVSAGDSSSIGNSLGVCDAFIGSVIYGLHLGWEVEATLVFASKIASKKHEGQGFAHLSKYIPQYFK